MHRDYNPPLKSIRPAANLPGFFKSVEEALKLFQQEEGVPDGTTPVLVHAFPKERLAKTDQPFDVITFRVKSSQMAPTNNAGDRVPRAPTLRQKVRHPEKERYTLQVFGWWELVEVEFTIWSRSNAQADAITDWFHRFLMKYAYAYRYFSARGIDKFRFVSRADDDIDLREGQEIQRRKLVYEVRLETLDAFEEKDLESVDMNIGINRPTDKIELSD